MWKEKETKRNDLTEWLEVKIRITNRTIEHWGKKKTETWMLWHDWKCNIYILIANIEQVDAMR